MRGARLPDATMATGRSAVTGTVTGAPRRWLRVEAAALLAGALVAYSTTHQSWWLVPLIVLLPDLAIAGYLRGTRAGAYLITPPTPPRSRRP